MEMSERDEAEVAWAAYRQVVEVTNKYVETMQQLATTYKKELGTLGIAWIQCLYVSDVKKLAKGDRSWHKEDIQTQCVWGDGHLIEGMVEDLNDVISR